MSQSKNALGSPAAKAEVAVAATQEGAEKNVNSVVITTEQFVNGACMCDN